MKSWSFSRYDTWSKCPWRAKLQYIDHAPIPDSPHADRGTMLHEQAQDWVAGKRDDLHADLLTFETELAALKQRYQLGQVTMEHEWAWTHSFAKACAWDADDAWVRMKLDFCVSLSPTHALIVDLKTGKKSGNEIKHTEQGQLYTVAVMLKEPEVEVVDVEFWYSDQDDTTKNRYTAAQAAPLLKAWTDRGIKVTSGSYPPRPNIFSCKYCPYRQVEDGGSGACEFAIKIIKAPRKKTSGFFDFGVK